MSSDDRETTEDGASELRTLSAAGAGNSQLYRELKFKNKQLRKTAGQQGQTIYRLRAELAEVRATHSKLDRGELRRLERVAQERLDEINVLQEKLAAAGQLDGGQPESST